MPDTPRPKANSDQAARELNVPGKYSEGSIKGLFLQVSATSKLWRFKYRLNKTEGLFSIGKFPDINWERACELAQEARTSVANGIAPLKSKVAKIEAQRAQEEWTFKKVAEQWLAFRSDLAPKTRSGHVGALKNHLYPVVGDVPVTDITSRHVNTLLNNLGQSPSVARHTLGLMRQILGYAIDLELLGNNVAVRRSSLLKKHKVAHHAALETPDDLAEFLRRLNEYVAYNDSVISALWLLVMLPVRPGELTDMRWEQLDLDKAEWRYTMSKTGQAHIVPLPTQAVGQLRALKDYSAWLASKGTSVPKPFGKTPQPRAGGTSGWVFPSSGKFGVPISADTLLVRIRTGLGYERSTITSHGFRSTFSTLGHEVLGIDPIVLELCLGHRMPGSLGATYARAQLLDQRRLAMQKWADYIEELWEAVVHGGTRKEFESALVGL
jgi:integrase